MNDNKMIIEYDEECEQLKIRIMHLDKKLYSMYCDNIEDIALEIMRSIQNYHVNEIIVSNFIVKYLYYDYADIEYLACVMDIEFTKGD